MWCFCAAAAITYSEHFSEWRACCFGDSRGSGYCASYVVGTLFMRLTRRLHYAHASLCIASSGNSHLVHPDPMQHMIFSFPNCMLLTSPPPSSLCARKLRSNSQLLNLCTHMCRQNRSPPTHFHMLHHIVEVPSFFIHSARFCCLVLPQAAATTNIVRICQCRPYLWNFFVSQTGSCA